VRLQFVEVVAEDLDPATWAFYAMRLSLILSPRR